MAWSYLPVNHNTCIAKISNTTLRGYFTNNLSGDKIRIRFSNLYSAERLILDKVTIAKRARGSKLIEGFQTVGYKGDDVISIGPGEQFLSDELKFSIDSSEDIIISIYIKNPSSIYSVCSTWSAGSWYTRYGLNGDYTMESEFAESDNYDMYPPLQYDEHRANHIYGINGIEVLTDENVKTFALFGDSITHMSYYSDALMQMATDKYPGRMTIINRGLGGNRLLHDYTRIPGIPGGGTIFGKPGVYRFYDDVYQLNKPDYVVVLIGINDFTHPYFFKKDDEKVTLEEYKEGICKLIHTAQSQGSKILIGTVIPFKKDKLEWFDEVEELRQEVNRWIREQIESDGVIDFDLAIRDRLDHEKIDDSCHLGDGIHPNTEGGIRMANVVPLDKLME
jgi:lysophospholipase L1-like esterase